MEHAKTAAAPPCRKCRLVHKTEKQSTAKCRIQICGLRPCIRRNSALGKGRQPLAANGRVRHAALRRFPSGFFVERRRHSHSSVLAAQQQRLGRGRILRLAADDRLGARNAAKNHSDSADKRHHQHANQCRFVPLQRHFGLCAAPDVSASGQYWQAT